MKRSHRNREEGFTLIELLVVIAIMAVLIGVAVSSFTGLIGSGTTESKDFEANAVQTAIDAHMAVQGETTITARTTAAVIASGDADAPFTTYLRSLPTKYKYVWTTAGAITQSE